MRLEGDVDLSGTAAVTCYTNSGKSVRGDPRRPPVKAGLAFEAAAVGIEGDALRGDSCVELGEGVEVLVDDWLVDMDPERLRRLQLGGVGRHLDEADTLGTTRPGAVCQPALSRTRRMMRSPPAPASRAKSARMFSKSSLSTPLPR